MNSKLSPITRWIERLNNRCFAQHSPASANRSETCSEKQMDAVAREFAATHDMKVKEEIERMAKEYGKLKELWRFVSK